MHACRQARTQGGVRVNAHYAITSVWRDGTWVLPKKTDKKQKSDGTLVSQHPTPTIPQQRTPAPCFFQKSNAPHLKIDRASYVKLFNPRATPSFRSEILDQNTTRLFRVETLYIRTGPTTHPSNGPSTPREIENTQDTRPVGRFWLEVLYKIDPMRNEKLIDAGALHRRRFLEPHRAL
ncbi:uncharacterized protein BDZ99DRAFT_39607 [Mytilinidion resinicola]|uniref:Uncharacterized protein n=1 Tax=Mytilinidion resinicola TaxID=574789 RepID=A0A6A6YJ01_9PEZI|nr:uncharacterized protein BDZ99DRAFT_39607 [Mytilinidion resinicola]KAF2808770.1 hypothetical protein BDZ99DRAFT_39607 [Mytilinidion resinicola]